MSDAPDVPEAVEGYVAYEQPNEPILKSPAEAEALAMNLLSAATSARAYRLAAAGDVPEEVPAPEDVERDGAPDATALPDGGRVGE